MAIKYPVEPHSKGSLVLQLCNLHPAYEPTGKRVDFESFAAWRTSNETDNLFFSFAQKKMIGMLNCI